MFNPLAATRYRRWCREPRLWHDSQSASHDYSLRTLTQAAVGLSGDQAIHILAKYYHDSGVDITCYKSYCEVKRQDLIYKHNIRPIRSSTTFIEQRYRRSNDLIRVPQDICQ